MQRLVFYRAYNDQGPCHVVSVSPQAFFSFLEDWTTYLERGFAREELAASAAA